MKIARKCYEEGRALVICANKRDVIAQLGVSARQYEKVPSLSFSLLFSSNDPQGIRDHCDQFLREFGELEIIATSAVLDTKSSMSPPRPRNPLDTFNNPLALNTPEAYMEKYSPEGVDRLLRAVIRTHDSWSRRIDTWILNTWLRDLQISIPQQRSGGRVLKVKYMTQVSSL
jgi:predicted GTPase